MRHARWFAVAFMAMACGTDRAPADTVRFDPATPAGSMPADAAVQAAGDASPGELPPNPFAVDAGGTHSADGHLPGDAAAAGVTPGDAGAPDVADAGRADAGGADAGAGGATDAGTAVVRVDAGPPVDDDD